MNEPATNQVQQLKDQSEELRSMRHRNYRQDIKQKQRKWTARKLNGVWTYDDKNNQLPDIP